MERGREDVMERKGVEERDAELYEDLHKSEAKLIRGSLFQTEPN